MAESKATRESRSYKPNGGYTKVHDEPSRDISDFIFRISAKHLASFLGAVIFLTAIAVFGYFKMSSKMDSLACDMRQVKDVVIYKQPLRQVECQ